MSKIYTDKERIYFIYELYQRRKDTGKPSRLECGDICRKEFGEDYDESAYRKIFESWDKVWGVVREYLVEDPQMLERFDKIDKRENELYKAKVQASDAFREHRKLLRDESRIDRLKDFFIDAFASRKTPDISIYEDKFVGDKSKHAILMVSDWHVGLKCDNYWNTCDLDVIKGRVEDMLNDTVRYCKLNNVGTIWIASLGDMISGSIHCSTRLAEELDSVEQSIFAAELLYKVIHALADFGFAVKYGSCVGNHDRKNKNFKEHIEKESFNKILDWYIEDKINNSEQDIEFISNEIDDGIGLFDIDGDLFPFVHGHQDKLGTIISDLSTGLGIQPRGVLCAHWHHKVTETKFKTKLFINGTLSGLDEYNKGRRFWTVPSQTLILLDGDNTIDIDINL